jgi:integrase
VPVPQRVVDSLRKLPNNAPRYFFRHRRKDGSEVKEESIVQIYGGWFREVCDAAGIPEGHSHMLRHSFATYYLARNVPVERVAEWMGDDSAHDWSGLRIGTARSRIQN